MFYIITDVSSEILNSNLKKEEKTKVISNYLKLDEQEIIDDHDKNRLNTSAPKSKIIFVLIDNVQF